MKCLLPACNFSFTFFSGRLFSFSLSVTGFSTVWLDSPSETPLTVTKQCLNRLGQCFAMWLWLCVYSSFPAVAALTFCPYAIHKEKWELALAARRLWRFKKPVLLRILFAQCVYTLFEISEICDPNHVRMNRLTHTRTFILTSAAKGQKEWRTGRTNEERKKKTWKLV